MTVTAVFPSNLRIKSKSDARKFYACIKGTLLIQLDLDTYLRLEPEQCFTVLDKETLLKGDAWMVPSLRDEDGSYAYQFRKAINRYLKSE